MKVRRTPYWLDRAPPRQRRSYPILRTSLEAPVVIVGGGLTGVATALALASARIPAVLLEAGSIGGGATAGAVGLIREDPDASFVDAASRHGLRAARATWQAVRRASLELPAAVRRLGIRCDLQRQDLLALAWQDPALLRTLRREYEARRAAGFDHRWMAPQMIRREAAVSGAAAIRTGALALDPFRAAAGLAAAAVRRGILVFEGSQVVKVKNGRQTVEVFTEHGSVTSGVVVFAGGASVPELRPLRRHLQTREGYGVVTGSLPAAIRREVGPRRHSLRVDGESPKFVRWLGEDRVLVAGAEQPPPPARLQDRTVAQRTGQLMYELSLLYPAISGTPAEWGWSFTFDETVDGLPYIGPHRNFPRHLFALGMGRHGAAISWLAARVLLRHITGTPEKSDELFGFTRILH